MTWRNRAACAGCPAEWFYDERGGTYNPRAVALCASCPVRAECYEDAIQTEGQHRLDNVFGYRGGAPAIERVREIKRRRAEGWQPDAATQREADLAWLAEWRARQARPPTGQPDARWGHDRIAVRLREVSA